MSCLGTYMAVLTLWYLCQDAKHVTSSLNKSNALYILLYFHYFWPCKMMHSDAKHACIHAQVLCLTHVQTYISPSLYRPCIRVCLGKRRKRHRSKIYIVKQPKCLVHEDPLWSSAEEKPWNTDGGIYLFALLHCLRAVRRASYSWWHLVYIRLTLCTWIHLRVRGSCRLKQCWPLCVVHCLLWELRLNFGKDSTQPSPTKIESEFERQMAALG